MNKITMIVEAVLLAAMAAGCATQIRGGDAPLAAEESPAYLDRMSSAKTICQNDAYRGVIMIMDGKDESADFAQRVQTLKDRGVVAAYWSQSADEPITKGRVAYMLYQACKFRGGLTLTLMGPTERYCLREMQAVGMMSSGATYTEMTGLEFVAAVNRADTYLQTGQLPDIMAAGAGEP